MKKKIQLLLILCTFSTSYCQKELWGYEFLEWGFQPPVPPEYNPGRIIKVPLSGNNQMPENIHDFDSTGLLGYTPKGNLLLASNGKLYGVCGSTYNDQSTILPSGFLFEYDPSLNKYRIVANNLNYPFLKYTKGSFIEPIPGILVGLSNNGANVFKLNINNDQVTLIGSLAEYQEQQYLRQPQFVGTLLKASDGNLYGVANISRNQFGVTHFGGIYKINMITNTLTLMNDFATDPDALIVWAPIGSLVEGTPGKLYGTAEGGLLPWVSGVNLTGSGTIYEYDMVTQGLTLKYAFNNLTEGKNPSPLIKASNNKLYGVLYCSSIISEFHADGVIYEYDFTTSSFNLLHVINYDTNGGIYQLSSIACKGSNGNFYGTSFAGIYGYNPITNTVTRKIAYYTGTGKIQDLIEICRKPSYQEILINTFTPAVGSIFTYNVQNTNATTYVWKRGTTVLLLQTTGTLTLTNVTTNDTGVYTCTMTNECGTTVTANLNVTVTNLATETVDTYKSEIALYPNPTKGTINLKFPENRGLKGIKYKITNLLGQVIQEAPIVAGKSLVSIDASAFPVGVYQVTLTTDKGDWNGKFVRE